LPGAPDTNRAAVDAPKAADTDEAAALDDLEDLKREAALFEDCDPAEILRDFRTENYWEFSERNEDLFSGREVCKIASQADREATESTAVDLVRQFLRINHNDRAALDLFAVAGKLSENAYQHEKREREAEAATAEQPPRKTSEAFKIEAICAIASMNLDPETFKRVILEIKAIEA
ncbi:MAG: hypothetical protein IKC53_11590, partial [Lentisphaeria bacterium]|nr:hypothetical protein [Lentisphaeria bacterium]